MGFLSILAGLQELALRTLQELADTTTACSNAMNALNEAKADKLALMPMTIPAAGWKKDSIGYYIDLSVSGITVNDCVAVLIAPGSKAVAEAAALTGTTESGANTLRLRAFRAPTAAIEAHYYIVREDILMALGPVSMGGSSYVLPPATANTLGGVMIGDGLSVDKNGKAAFAPAAMTNPTAKALSTKLAGEGLSVDENGKMNVDQTGALAFFPVGIVISMVGDTSPAALFGGTWEEIAPDRVLMGASSSHAAGTTVEAGLPNITGSFVANVHYNRHAVSGAFTASNLVTSTGANDSDERTYKFSLDASKSNAIYGRSTTVQPAAYYVHYWQRKA